MSPAPTLPPGFRPNAAGLLVPEEHSRYREVWTKAEWLILERATKLLTSRGIALYLRCKHEGCHQEPMSRVRQADGGITLRCSHKDRVCVAALK